MSLINMINLSFAENAFPSELSFYAGTALYKIKDVMISNDNLSVPFYPSF